MLRTINKSLLILAMGLLLSSAFQAQASSFPANAYLPGIVTGEWSDPGNVGVVDLLNTSYFGDGSYQEISYNPFVSGSSWDYTAIAYEAGNRNITEEGGSLPTFSTKNTSGIGSVNAFGEMAEITFLSGGSEVRHSDLYFEDSNGPYNVSLMNDALSGNFRLFKLNEASSELTWLDDLILSEGTIIIGFNDNGVPTDGDSDYDDIVVAMSQVPLPSAFWLFGSALIGFVTLANRRKV
jgi:hypothetical protein